MPVSPARAAAFDILLRVERESSYATELLHAKTYSTLSAADHALTTELVMGVLRWRSLLDHEISSASSQPLSKLDPEVLIALRLALYQFRRLTRIPKRAALHESVELVKRARKRSAVPFVNAVLRKLTSAADTPPEPTSAETLARDLAHPLWLVERWIAQYGFPSTLQICRHNQSVPETALRLRTRAAEANLQSETIRLQPGQLLSSARRTESGDITNTESFRRGEFVIQDEASQLVAMLIGRTQQAGSRILDCCAAPGGKTLAMADRHPTAEVTAVEIHPHRARLLQKLLGTSKEKIHTLVADATHLPLTTPYDRVLADVPCSGTGTLARNPEIKWRLTPADLRALHSRQTAILSSALARLAPGGRLVYSTCSLEKEENEDVLEEILRENSSLQLLDCAAELRTLKQTADLIWPDPDSLTRGPYLRTLPGIHPCDGFFAAILERSK